MKQLLFNPFQRFNENQLIVFGIIATAFGSWSAALFNSRYDGSLDMHYSIVQNWYTPLLDNIIDITCLTLFLVIAGKIVNQKTRVVDVLATSLVARTPLYFLPFFNFDGSLSVDVVDKTLTELQAVVLNNIVIFAISGIFALIILVWYIALLYNGYKTASNGKGAKSIFLFIGALLAAEVISKILIIYLN